LRAIRVTHLLFGKGNWGARMKRAMTVLDLRKESPQLFIPLRIDPCRFGPKPCGLGIFPRGDGAIARGKRLHFHDAGAHGLAPRAGFARV
jgi:hypothetical protein